MRERKVRMAEDLKIWTCKSGHALGQIRRSGRGIHQLFLYRQAVSFDQETPEQVDILAVIEGTVLDIRCGICGEVRTWMAGQEAMDRLLASYASMHQLDVEAFLFQVKNNVQSGE